MRLLLAAISLSVSAVIGSVPMVSVVTEIAGPDTVPIRERPASGLSPSCSRAVLTGAGPSGDGRFPVRIGPSEDYRLVQRLTSGQQVLAFEDRNGWTGIVWGRRDRLCGAPGTRAVSGANQGWVPSSWLIIAPFQSSF